MNQPKNRQNGNLALKYAPESNKTYDRSSNSKYQASAAYAAPVKTTRIKAEPVKQPISMVNERTRQIRRELTLQRIRSLLGIVCAVVFVSGLFGGMVWRQSKILSDNFKNLAIQREIKRLDEVSGQISENLALKTELSQIRTEAVQSLGLQIPARSQMVSVVVPDTDRVVFNDKARVETDEDAHLMNLLFSLEGFFKTLDVKGAQP
ncbi:MAG: hypothetical protein GX749_09115 [Ruminococcaceae bacterium]|nr:hypothetical protein [Oscillospiraceae bacterium]